MAIKHRRARSRQQRFIRTAVAFVIVLFMTGVIGTLAEAGSGTVHFWTSSSSGRHYRKNTAAAGLTQSHIHFAVIPACTSGGAWATSSPSYTRSYSHAPSWHRVYSASNQELRRYYNGGVHWFFDTDGTKHWSPGRDNGWDHTGPDC